MKLQADIFLVSIRHRRQRQFLLKNIQKMHPYPMKYLRVIMVRIHQLMQDGMKALAIQSSLVLVRILIQMKLVMYVFIMEVIVSQSIFQYIHVLAREIGVYQIMMRFMKFVKKEILCI